MIIGIQRTLEDLYKAMLEVYPLNFEEFKTKVVDQEENFQGIGIILTEGLYAFENLDFEQQAPQQTTEETTNDNQETTVSEDQTPTGTY
tara:strand:+ start:4259 stop:4525 length:267 start_codon:yes stop_codon:yes gene_type:complete